MTFKPAGIKALFNQHIFFVTTVELYLLASGPDVRRRAAGGCSASCRRQRHLRLSKGNMRLLRGRDPSPRLSAQYNFQMLVAVPCSAQNSNPIERSPRAHSRKMEPPSAQAVLVGRGRVRICEAIVPKSVPSPFARPPSPSPPSPVPPHVCVLFSELRRAPGRGSTGPGPVCPVRGGRGPGPADASGIRL